MSTQLTAPLYMSREMLLGDIAAHPQCRSVAFPSSCQTLVGNGLALDQHQPHPPAPPHAVSGRHWEEKELLTLERRSMAWKVKAQAKEGLKDIVSVKRRNCSTIGEELRSPSH